MSRAASPQWRIGRDVAWVLDEDRGTITCQHLPAPELMVLDGVGATIFLDVVDGLDPVQAAQERWPEGGEDVAEATRAFVGQMTDLGVMEPTDSDPAPRRALGAGLVESTGEPARRGILPDEGAAFGASETSTPAASPTSGPRPAPRARVAPPPVTEPVRPPERAPAAEPLRHPAQAPLAAPGTAPSAAPDPAQLTAPGPAPAATGLPSVQAFGGPRHSAQYRVLFVCTANICRSAYIHKAAEAAGIDGVQFDSAGTHALVGQPVDPPLAAELDKRGIATGHAAKQLTRDLVAGADLVIALASEHRRFIVEEWPDLANRVFVVGHASRVLGDVPEDAPLTALPSYLWANRTVDRHDSVADPYGRGRAVAAKCARTIDAHLARLLHAFRA